MATCPGPPAAPRHWQRQEAASPGACAGSRPCPGWTSEVWAPGLGEDGFLMFCACVWGHLLWLQLGTKKAQDLMSQFPWQHLAPSQLYALHTRSQPVRAQRHV